MDILTVTEKMIGNCFQHMPQIVNSSGYFERPSAVINLIGYLFSFKKNIISTKKNNHI